MANFLRWAVTFAFQLTDEEKDTLSPFVEAQDLALLQAAVEKVCAAHDFGPDGCIIVDMWRNGDDTEMELM